MKPDYCKIYKDMLWEKFPEKFNDKKINQLLSKETLNSMEIVHLNNLVFDNRQNKTESLTNQKLRSYDPETIRNIILYQKKNKLTNSAVANEFKLSRNTLKKWKDLFVEI